MMGDLNDHPTTSCAMAQSHTVGMHRLTKENPTTLAKDGAIASKPPFDHCLVNQKALDLGMQVMVDATLRMSDHLPILLKSQIQHPVFWQTVWSKPTKPLPPKTCIAPWTALPLTFEQWQHAACDWLNRSYTTEVEPKGTVSLLAYTTKTQQGNTCDFEDSLPYRERLLRERDASQRTAAG